MYTKRNIVSTKETRANFFKNSKEHGLDETTFNMWKSELEKELPSFWESVNDIQEKINNRLM